MSKALPIVIRGTGSYLPERKITNQHFVDYLDTSEEWIITRTGIKERRWVAQGQTTSDLGTEACKKALADANMTIDDIDAIVCATSTGDHAFPATASHIQGSLDAKLVPAFDVSAACAGFVVGVITGAGLISTGGYKNVLVVGAEALSLFSDMNDRGTGILFGDAAGAAVFSAAEEETDRGILHFEMGTDGSKADYINLPAGGAKRPASVSSVEERQHYLHMRGREVFKFAVVKLEKLIDRALESLNIKPDDLKMIIPHQSNMRIIEAARQRLGLAPEKMAVNIDRYGNTSAASIPVAFDEGRKNGSLREGDLVLMVAIGAGLTWGCMVMRL